MFDTNKVANNIRNARTKLNMTQMNLADELGVSYQAVSNWERGNSMPDISKLPELCKILNISFEKLVDEKSEQTAIAEKLMKEKEEVTLEEMAQVVPLVKPDKLEDKVAEAMKKEEKISFATLIGLAPFMDKDKLGKMAEELADIDMRNLAALAPFLSTGSMDKIIEKQIMGERLDVNHVVAVAPFLARETVKKIVDYMMTHGQSSKIVTIAPFMGRDMFPSNLQEIEIDGASVVVNVADASEKMYDLEEDEAAEQAFVALENGNNVEEYLDYMDSDDVAKLALRALELGKNTESYLDYMDSDDVAKLALRTLENGKDTEIFLDYMDEDDVRDLAFAAFESGKSIECYLDYMDEDAIKELLLKSMRK